MTKASEVTVTDAEVLKFMDDVENAPRMRDMGVSAHKAALAAFLAARVPDASSNPYCGHAHNALRDAVLKGPQA